MKKPGAGLIGTGWVSNEYIKAFQQNVHCEVAAICTPHDQHAGQGIASARAGKHVLVEKPAALTLAGLRSLARAIEEAGVKSVTSFVLRWNPMFANIRAMLDQRLIGDIFYAEVDYFHGIGPWYGSWKWLTSKQTGGSSL